MDDYYDDQWMFNVGQRILNKPAMTGNGKHTTYGDDCGGTSWIFSEFTKINPRVFRLMIFLVKEFSEVQR